ncbi:conserved hypothetical protein [Pseudomonas sp. 8Z]|nr:conserved hypothetical protein [Pseudomonas sp. 8Z]
MVFEAWWQDVVFPAPAGMNRTGQKPSCATNGVPRASGDEPGVLGQTMTADECSPRQRG